MDAKGIYRGGGTSIISTGVIDHDPTADFSLYVYTWSMSNTRNRFYRNAVKASTDGTLTDALAGTVATCGVGKYTQSEPNGYIQHVVLINREITQAEIDAVYP